MSTDLIPTSELPPAIRAILRPSTIVGEDPAIFDELLALAVQEHNPKSWSEWMLVKQRIDAELDILRFGLVRKWVLNAAIARGLHKQIVDAQVEKSIIELRNKGGFCAQGDPGYEERLSQGWWRRMKRLSFAAVSGDNDAVQTIEKEIGGNKIGFGAETVADFESSMACQLFLDRSLSAAISRRDAACRELDRLALRRSKKAGDVKDVNDVPLTPADVSIGSQLSEQQDVSQTVPGDTESVHAPSPTPPDETTAQEASKETPGS